MNHTDKPKTQTPEKDHDQGDGIIVLTDKVSDLSKNSDEIISGQLEKTMERVIEKMFSEKIEGMIVRVIEKVVKKEIDRIKRKLVEDVPGNDFD
jgi:hypothetical protein